MIKNQIDQYDMILSTEEHLDDNVVLYSSNLAIVESKGAFSQKITVLATQIARQLENPMGLTIEKNTFRKNLEDQTFVLGAGCASYASANANTNLYNRCHYTKTDLLHFRDAELVGIGTNMHADVSAHAAVLVPYNITAAMIDTYQDTLAGFRNTMKNPTESIAKRKTATANIAQMLPEIMNFLTTRLDNDLVSMTSTKPDFVSTYTNVRSISDSPRTTLSLTVTVLDAATNTPLPNADVEVLNENIRRKSSSRGYNTVLNLVPGDHNLQVSRPGYITQNIHFAVVAGETTELVVLLQGL